MTTHYRVLRPVEQADLDASPGSAGVLKLIPNHGYVTFDIFGHIEKRRASRGVMHACSVGIFERASPYDRISSLDSVRFWCTQLNDYGHKNTAPTHSTRQLYMHGISKLDGWLPGRSFPSFKTVWRDGEGTRQGITKSFGNVEELMNYCTESDYGTKTAQRVVREYLASQPVTGASASMQAIIRSAIKSYFGVHDIVLDMPKVREKRDGSAPEDDSPMTLEDFYKMLQNGKPGIALRAAMLIKFQSGMDTSTFTDRFNYEGYPQIVRHFKTDDYTMWNVDLCPVPIRLVRVKTGVQYTTFIDRDAVTQLQEYLTWKEAKYGRQDASKPLFLTVRNTAVCSEWLSKGFSNVAVRAGIQKKISHRVYRIRSHEVRDLLKSTLLACGCAQYAADHILGHAPRDSYEKQAVLYPEALRAEYAKASASLNIFSKMESTLNSPKDPESQDERIRELEAQVKALAQANTEKDLMKVSYMNAMSEMNEKINRLARLLDKMPEDVKEGVSDELDGVA